MKTLCKHATGMRRTLHACALLRWAGCTITKADASGITPFVRVDRRPRLDWLANSPAAAGAPLGMHAVMFAGIRIEWPEDKADATRQLVRLALVAVLAGAQLRRGGSPS
jgi:hypothetical protein